MIDAELDDTLDICQHLNEAHTHLEPAITAARDASKADRADRMHIGWLTTDFRFYALQALESNLQSVQRAERPKVVATFVARYATKDALDEYARHVEIAHLRWMAGLPQSTGRHD